MYFVGQPVIWLCYSLECSILTHSPCYLPPWSRDPAVVGDLVGQPQKCGPIQRRPTQLFHQIGYVRQKRRCDPTPSMKASAGQPATHRGLCAPLTQLRPRGISAPLCPSARCAQSSPATWRLAPYHHARHLSRGIPPLVARHALSGRAGRWATMMRHAGPTNAPTVRAGGTAVARGHAPDGGCCTAFHPRLGGCGGQRAPRAKAGALTCPPRSSRAARPPPPHAAVVLPTRSHGRAAALPTQHLPRCRVRMRPPCRTLSVTL